MTHVTRSPRPASPDTAGSSRAGSRGGSRAGSPGSSRRSSNAFAGKPSKPVNCSSM